jgi:hypothetical protein
MKTYTLTAESTGEVQLVRASFESVKHIAHQVAEHTGGRVRIILGGVKLYTAQPTATVVTD